MALWSSKLDVEFQKSKEMNEFIYSINTNYLQETIELLSIYISNDI
jgi:hypothetical protein